MRSGSRSTRTCCRRRSRDELGSGTYAARRGAALRARARRRASPDRRGPLRRIRAARARQSVQAHRSAHSISRAATRSPPRISPRTSASTVALLGALAGAPGMLMFALLLGSVALRCRAARSASSSESRTTRRRRVAASPGFCSASCARAGSRSASRLCARIRVLVRRADDRAAQPRDSVRGAFVLRRRRREPADPARARFGAALGRRPLVVAAGVAIVCWPTA